MDKGDQNFGDGRRRVYRLKGWVRRVAAGETQDTTEHITAVCKVRWIEKKGDDPMIITNFEALRHMMLAMIEKDKNEAQVEEQEAYRCLEADTRDYLAGLLFTPRVQTVGFGMQCAGGML